MTLTNTDKPVCEVIMYVSLPHPAECKVADDTEVDPESKQSGKSDSTTVTCKASHMYIILIHIICRNSLQ